MAETQSKRIIKWSANPGPQAEALSMTWCDQLFFGGARGGGKSEYLLMDFFQDIQRYGEHWQGILFRRTYPELQELIRRSQILYHGSGGVWHEQAKEWRWPNGAILRMRYLEHPRDASRYQGHEYSWIGWDELPQWATDEAYKMLLACRRGPCPRKRVRASGNPGGPGHSWVKQYFVDYAPLGFEIRIQEKTGQKIAYIPSKVTDNPKLLEKDPDYVRLLHGVGSPELVRAWLEGDWNVIAGAYWPEFSIEKHVKKPFTIPAHWTKFSAFDWGYSAPFCCLWFAVSDGTIAPYKAGDLIVYREWYGCEKGELNKGLKLTIEQIANGILMREQGEELRYRVADPAIFAEEGGASMAELFRKSGVTFRRADNQRIPGWIEVRQKFKGIDDKPSLYIFSTCSKLIETIPLQQHDDKNPEDMATDGPDHGLDTLRYGIKSRPVIQEITKKLEWSDPGKSGIDVERAFREARAALEDDEYTRI